VATEGPHRPRVHGQVRRRCRRSPLLLRLRGAGNGEGLFGSRRSGTARPALTRCPSPLPAARAQVRRRSSFREDGGGRDGRRWRHRAAARLCGWRRRGPRAPRRLQDALRRLRRQGRLRRPEPRPGAAAAAGAARGLGRCDRRRNRAGGARRRRRAAAAAAGPPAGADRRFLQARVCRPATAAAACAVCRRRQRSPPSTRSPSARPRRPPPLSDPAGPSGATPSSSAASPPTTR